MPSSPKRILPIPKIKIFKRSLLWKFGFWILAKSDKKLKFDDISSKFGVSPQYSKNIAVEFLRIIFIKEVAS